MKLIYTLCYFIIVVFMVSCIVYAKRKKDITSRVLIYLHGTVLLAATNYLIYMWCGNKTVATFFYGLYNLNMPWIVTYVGGLTFYLSGLYRRKKIMKSIFVVFGITAVLDALSEIGNTVFNHLFKLNGFVDKAGVVYWVPEFSVYNLTHLLYCYVIVVCVIGVIIWQSKKTSKIYRSRYLCLLSIFAACVILNMICLKLKLFIDFSPVFYGLLSTFTSFMILKAIPEDLVAVMMRSVSENIKSGIACFDINGKCVYINKVARVIFKVKRNGLIVVEEYRDKVLAERCQDKHSVIFEDKFVINEETHTYSIEYKDFIDAKSMVIGSYLKFDDRTHDIKRLENEIYKGSHDVVTGLLNRRAFFSKASEIIQSNPGIDFYLVATDIENFKLINDLFGAEIGDKILIAQAQMLSLANFENCVHGRIAGDRFAMLIPKAKFNQKMAVVNTRKIQNLLPEVKYKMNMYLGVYEVTDRDEPAEKMYDKACQAIESIHGDYELTLAFYDSKVTEKDLYEKTLLNTFQSSLDENRFVFFLQPLIGKDSGNIVGAEALCRWNHTSYGLIQPEDFLSVLEKTDAIFKMDSYIWRTACEKLADWKAQGKEDLFISVNISSKDFYFGNLYEIFTGLVEEFGIDPSRLKLEITESVIMKDIRRHKDIISRLRKYGFQIEMDDFGSGYSSLSVLKDIPMDVLKMDMEFLNQSESNETKLKIVKLAINMAKKLDMTVVAEGIECEEQVEALRDTQCDIFQGYYYSKPMAVNAFELKYLKGGEK